MSRVIYVEYLDGANVESKILETLLSETTVPENLVLQTSVPQTSVPETSDNPGKPGGDGSGNGGARILGRVLPIPQGCLGIL